jgi:hypothetical protein
VDTTIEAVLEQCNADGADGTGPAKGGHVATLSDAAVALLEE